MRSNAQCSRPSTSKPEMKKVMGRSQASRPGLLLMQTCVLAQLAKPLGRDDKKFVLRKTEGLYFKTFCQERPLEQTQPLGCIPEGQTAVARSAGFSGKHFKKKEEKEEENKPFVRDHFCFYRETGKDVRKFWWEGIKGDGIRPLQLLLKLLLNQAAAFRQGPVIDYKCWNLFQ